ncbi:hypothetical protein ACO0QE_004120 [Hanseniaspora vineae]
MCRRTEAAQRYSPHYRCCSPIMNYLNIFKTSSKAKSQNKKKDTSTSTNVFNKQRQNEMRSERLFKLSKGHNYSKSTLSFINSQKNNANSLSERNDIDSYLYPNRTRNASAIFSTTTVDHIDEGQRETLDKQNVTVEQSTEDSLFDLNNASRKPQLDQITSPLIVETSVGECIQLRNKFFLYMFGDFSALDDITDASACDFSELQQPILGPPDMIHVTTRNNKFTSDEIGQFFLVTGIPCWNIDLMITYMKFVFEQVSVPSGGKVKLKTSEKPKLSYQDFIQYQGRHGESKSKKKSGQISKPTFKLKNKTKSNGNIITLFTYDVFRKSDVRLKYDIDDESYQIYLFDPLDGHSDYSTAFANDIDKYGTGQDEEVAIWDKILISNIMRSVIFNKKPEWKLPGMVELDYLIKHGEKTDLVMTFEILGRMLEYMPMLLLESGMEESVENEVNLLNNYMIQSFMELLSIFPSFYDAVIERLKNDFRCEPEYADCYDLIYLFVLLRCDTHELEFVEQMYVSMQKYKDNEWIMAQLLFLQLEYLFKYQKDYEFALRVNAQLVKQKPYMVAPWIYLTLIYKETGQYEKLLHAINNVPRDFILDADSINFTPKTKYISFFQKHYVTTYFYNGCFKSAQLDYLSRINNLSEQDVLSFSKGQVFYPLPCISLNGYIDHIWNNKTILLMSPVFCGDKCHNLLEFANANEIKVLKENNEPLLERSVHAFSSDIDKFVYAVLAETDTYLGWTRFAETFNSAFSNANLSSKNVLTEIATLGKKVSFDGEEVKHQRHCKDWFIAIVKDYCQDKRLVDGYLRELHSGREVFKSNLEWNLYGCLLYRTRNFRESVQCFRTCIENRFDPISAVYLLNICLFDGHDYDALGIVHSNVKKLGNQLEIEMAISVKTLLRILVYLISYDFRFYNNVQIRNIAYLKRVLQIFYNNDTELLINALYSLVHSSSEQVGKFRQENEATFNQQHDQRSAKRITDTNTVSLINAISYIVHYYIM